MDTCICIQCYCKPIETLTTLKSLEQCIEIKRLNLLLFIDKAEPNSKFENKNNELIKLLYEYEKNNHHMYNSITIYIPQNNLGPYLACCNCIDIAFTMNKFIIFSEDDAIFSKDSIHFYNNYREGHIPNNDIQCLGISSQSIHFYSNDPNCFNNLNNNIQINSKYIENINCIKQQVLDTKLLNKIQKINWAPNKQFGMFKNNWEKIKYFRTIDYYKSIASKTVAPDTATGIFVKENNYFFYYSIVPRTNDIGLFNEYGCTTLYFKGSVSISTIKYITSDVFNDTTFNKNYELVDNIPFSTII